MSKQLLTPALRELRAAFIELDEISSRPETSKRDEQRVNVLLAKIAALRSNPTVAADDTVRKFFSAMIRGEQPAVEQRGTDMLAGSQSIAYTQGNVGGFLVPQEFHDEVVLGLSQNDPFLNGDVVTLIESDTYALRPYPIPGWDLSGFTAVQIAEGAQQNPGTVPTVASTQLGAYSFKASLDASFELEQDDFQPIIKQMQKAYALAFAKGIGAALTTGNGTSAPQGAVTGAQDSGITTAGAAAITAGDIESIYFKLDAAYRNNPKCAWAVNDTIYQQIRKAADTNLRPLIDIVGDRMVLMGKPILISPTMSATAGQKGILFGDFSYFYVRVSKMLLQRSINASGYAEKGKALWTANMRADAKVFDPTGGASSGAHSPILFATLHA